MLTLLAIQSVFLCPISSIRMYFLTPWRVLIQLANIVTLALQPGVPVVAYHTPSCVLPVVAYHTPSCVCQQLPTTPPPVCVPVVAYHTLPPSRWSQSPVCQDQMLVAPRETLNLCKCSLVFLSIPQYSSVFLSIPQYSIVFLSVPQYSSVFLSIPQYSIVFLSVPQYSSVFPQYSSVFLSVPQYSYSSVLLSVWHIVVV